MPIDETKLKSILKEMKALFEKDPEASIRSKVFINKLHEYCEYELKRLGINEKIVEIKSEVTLYGSHKPKDVDVVVLEKHNGALIGISVKSQMSSIAKNFMGYYENLIGDAIGLHDRFPFLVLGMLYLLPLETIREAKGGGKRKESHNLQKIEQLLEVVSNRHDWDDRPEKYEHFALLVVDFSKDPPEIVKTLPKNAELRLDDFFDKLLKTYNKRNPFLEIIKKR